MDSRLGFSLPEILITLILMAMLVILAVPGYETQIKKSHQQTLSAQILRSISLAKSEAQVRGMTVTLCGSDDHLTCQDSWQYSQILFVDEKADGSITDKDQIIYVFDNGRQNANLHWRSALGRHYLQMQPDGMTRGENGTFWYCASGEKTARWAIKVSQSGRTRLINYPDNELQSLVC